MTEVNYKISKGDKIPDNKIKENHKYNSFEY